MSLKPRKQPKEPVETPLPKQLEALGLTPEDLAQQPAPVDPEPSMASRFKGWIGNRLENRRMNRAYKDIGQTAVMIAEANLNSNSK